MATSVATLDRILDARAMRNGGGGASTDLKESNELGLDQDESTAAPSAQELRKQRQRERYHRLKTEDPGWVERHRETDRLRRRAEYEGKRETILAKARERRIEKRIEQLREKAAQPPPPFERRQGRPRLDATRDGPSPSTEPIAAGGE